MPPKAKQEAAKAKAKAEDKTFGLKNKSKSSKVQKYVQQVVQQSATNTAKAARVAAVAGTGPTAKDKKKLEEERQKELNALFAVAIKQPKVPPGVDPKSLLCEFFRHGQCTKGFKCKFSHDWAVERKGAKIDLFTDQRDLTGEGDDEGMEDWDQETLEKVVNEKHGKEAPANTTNIICKFFLEAVEKRQYGWFWKCPNGSDCKYRHALPPGYVLKSQMKELLDEEARNTKDAAEEIEEQRAKIDARTPITEDVFRAWRNKKVEVRRAQKAKDEEDRRKKGLLTGREMFLQEGFVVEDDAGASGADELMREGQDEEERAIQEMLDRARDAAAHARQRAATEPSSLRRVQEGDDEDQDGEGGSGSESEEGGPAGSAGSSSAQQQGSGSQAGPSGSSGENGASTQRGVVSTHLQLEDDADLFDDDDDDEDDEELDELEANMQAKAQVS